MKTLHSRKALLISLFLLIAAPVAHAQTTKDSELTQTINAGVLSTDIVDASDVSVTNPSFAMTPLSVSTLQQSSTGTFGGNSQRILVDNPGGANNGWSLAIAGTNGPGTTLWDSGANTYEFDGAPADGQLTLDPSVASLTSQVGTSTGITLGSLASFSFGVVDSITLFSASAGSDDIWRGYITDVDVSQTIPGGQPSGNYVLDLTQTVTAL